MLFGSPKKDGFTASLLNKFLGTLIDYDVEIINSYEEKINPCIDCGLCKDKNICCFDDFEKIDKLLNSADLLIVATPVYNLSFPAPLKAIFDRMQRYFYSSFSTNKTKDVEYKKAVLILTCGSENEDGITVIKKQLKLIFSILNAKIQFEVIRKNTDYFGELE